MIIENSIESRILQLQEKKKALFDSTVGKDMNALAQVRGFSLFTKKKAKAHVFLIVIRRRFTFFVCFITF
jgi:SNF2 family DNA or RNA helicase